MHYKARNPPLSLLYKFTVYAVDDNYQITSTADVCPGTANGKQLVPHVALDMHH
jgi:hypothetical protein